MRYKVFAAVVSLVVAGMVGIAPAAGLQKVGEEECRCSPLVANGIIPDVWNQLALLLTVPSIDRAVDSIATDVKAVVGQFGINGDAGVAAAIVPQGPAETESATKPKAEKGTELKKRTAKTRPRKIPLPKKAPSSGPKKAPTP